MEKTEYSILYTYYQDTEKLPKGKKLESWFCFLFFIYCLHLKKNVEMETF